MRRSNKGFRRRVGRTVKIDCCFAHPAVSILWTAFDSLDKHIVVYMFCPHHEATVAEDEDAWDESSSSDGDESSDDDNDGDRLDHEVKSNGDENKDKEKTLEPNPQEARVSAPAGSRDKLEETNTPTASAPASEASGDVVGATEAKGEPVTNPKGFILSIFFMSSCGARLLNAIESSKIMRIYSLEIHAASRDTACNISYIYSTPSFCQILSAFKVRMPVWMTRQSKEQPLWSSWRSYQNALAVIKLKCQKATKR